MTKARDNSKFGNFAGNEVFLDSDKDTSITADTDDQIDIKTGGTDRVHIDSSGNVGIGTSSPSTALHVSSTGTPVFRIQDADGSDYYAQISQATGNTIFDTRFGASNGAFIFRGLGGGVADEYMRIDISGNVGIGTTSPSHNLDVQGGTEVIAQVYSDSAGATRSDLRLRLNNTTGVNYLTFGDSASFDVGRIEYSHTTDSMSFVTNSSERMRIDSSGNVGIGTSSPQTKLDIGPIDSNLEGAEIKLRGATNGTVDWNMDVYGSDFRVFNTDKGAGTSFVERMRIDSSGNVGIGTSSPSGVLDIKDTTDSRWLFSRNGTETELKIISGTNEDSALYFGDNADNVRVGIRHDSSANALRFMGYNNTERMRIDSSGNVGIGTTSPTHKLHVLGTSNDTIDETKGTMKVQASGGNGMLLGTIASSPFTSYIQSAFVVDTSVARYNLALNPIGGNVSIGVTSPYTDGGTTSILNVPVGGSSFGAWISKAGTTSSRLHLRFANPNGIVGSISTSGTATAFTTSSDYRLKENVDYTFDATTRLKQLKPCRFNFIADESNTLVDGFIAHEVSSIVPEAISGEKDAMMTEEYEVTPAVLDDDGNIIEEAVMGTREVPDYQGIDQSKLVPLLVKTIQELEARITALENN